MSDVPLPISKLVLESISDDLGFTASEKIVLRNAWKLISPNIEDHAKELFLNFFTEHEELLEHFRDKNGELKMHELHAHPYKIFSFLEAIIIEGLEGVNEMHKIVSPVALCHFHRNVASHEITMKSDAVGEYLKGVLQRVLSPTLERSIEKLCQIIVRAHQ